MVVDKYKNVLAHREKVGLKSYRERYKYATAHGVSSEIANRLKFKSTQAVEDYVESRLRVIKKQLVDQGVTDVEAEKLKFLPNLTLEHRGYVIKE